MEKINAMSAKLQNDWRNNREMKMNAITCGERRGKKERCDVTRGLLFYESRLIGNG